MSVAFNQVTNRGILDRVSRRNPPADAAVGDAPTRATKSGKKRSPSSSIERESANEEKPAGNELPSTSGTDGQSSPVSYAIVRNIPPRFHASDLRGFFSAFVENRRFRCFHFRHRPDIQATTEKDASSTSLQDATTDPKKKRGMGKRMCCVVQFANRGARDAFIAAFHTRHWTDASGNELPLRCFIFPIRIAQSRQETGEEANRGESLNDGDVREMIELRPPIVMPQGNVGTPSEFFLEQIRLCKLPATLIGKLGLKAKRRTGKFGAVPMDYGNTNKRTRRMAKQPMEEDGEGESTHHSVFDDKTMDKGSLSDDEEMEEWERHEALYDDVTEQERIGERKYEEEMEIVWEKGGPGLVWYTDQMHWRETEMNDDCDWAWADDWDVDYSAYYERGVGDLDARQAVEMRHGDALESGSMRESVFRSRKTAVDVNRRRRRASDSDAAIGEAAVGRFERHTKGFAGRYMRKLGWTPGRGLGVADRPGQPYPVLIDDPDDQAQSGSSRGGLGFRGEKLQRTGLTKRKEQHTIATKYDKRNEDGQTDEQNDDTLLRRHELTHMKFRR